MEYDSSFLPLKAVDLFNLDNVKPSQTTIGTIMSGVLVFPSVFPLCLFLSPLGTVCNDIKLCEVIKNCSHPYQFFILFLYILNPP